MGHRKTSWTMRLALCLAVVLAGTLPCLTPQPVASQEGGRTMGGRETVPGAGVPIPASLPQRRIDVPMIPGGERPLPLGWSVKEFTGKADVGLEKVGRLFAVRLSSNRSSFSLHRGMDVDIAEYPYLSWAWRVDRLPPRGDGRRSDTDDQAAQLYVVFPGFPAPFQIIGYTWDSTAPAGTVFRSSKNPMVKMMVLRSGPAQIGEWIWESRNVMEDFRKLFKEDPTEVMAIALLANSQNTQSSSESRFASLVFSRDRLDALAGRAATTASSSRPPR